MKIIINNLENEVIIKKSKFIGIIKKVNNKDEIINLLNTVKNQYNDATHICYAYILNNDKKYSDDNEPSGTAGKPILTLLEKQELNYVIAIVVRYFGGIKLGSNGLIHAYSDTIKDLLINNIKDLEIGYKIMIKIDYENLKKIEYILKDSIILEKVFNNDIILTCIIKKEILEKLSNTSYTILDEVIL